MLPDADDGDVESGRRQAGHFGELVGRLEGVSSLTPYLAPTRYMNYLESDAPEAAAVAYGPNLHRLRDLKRKWDPDNVFHNNVNILPR